MNIKQLLVKSARAVTGPFVFKKSLPKDLGGQKIFVSSRSDIRLLAPGLERSAGDLLTVVRNYVSEGSVVWDIGSNLGILSFCSAAKGGSQGKVYSLEADPRYADIQSRTLRNLSSNQKIGEVSILCAAAADRAGILDLVIPKKGHARNQLSIVEGNSTWEADMKKQVVTITLDSLLEHWSPPNFIKIDIEGAELLALEGGKRLFSEIRPVGYIECSFANSERLTKIFADLDYDLFTLELDGTEIPTDKFEFNTIVKPRKLSREGDTTKVQ
ncbi:FkbM family methyltransferase [Akkermansiaceae bacterium]|nr:FkbM family methyltransferase [Akkermansiaceae bacterium]MDB4282177.1 FkbM family methyltransferase [Akkermansiaceae bacterium]MDB4310012.1 FkbM family methyltransferase [Akkermansiaceae bacterium]MDB4804679.1 FkbM family methyltransferase [Akkermansiaceae bacterium]MDC0286855.1 FkbM family methyltransferase [Akkermansiaceae bacterium]